MTSSLVGSEMCIRDRSFAISRPFPPGAGYCLGYQPSLPLLSQPASLGPVSYTHLTLPTICSV
eukprot:11112492-Prorocentrum_lima.AAC.1